MMVAALIAFAILALLALFQVALAAGAPLGRFAWGGQHEGKLPRRLRIGSAFSIVVYSVIAAFVLGALEIIAIDASVLAIGLWVIAGYFMLGTLLNAISRSRHERFVMTPIAAVLAVCFLVLAVFA